MYKLGRALKSRILTFMIGYNSSEVVKKSTPNSPYNMNPTVLENIFILLEKNGSSKGLSIASSGFASKSFTSLYSVALSYTQSFTLGKIPPLFRSIGPFCVKKSSQDHQIVDKARRLSF